MVLYVIFHFLNPRFIFQGWCTAWSMITINLHEWEHILWSMESQVVPTFFHGQLLNRLCLFIICKATKIHFYTFIRILSFHIKMGMVREDVSQLTSQTRKLVLPKITSENWISINYNNSGNSMQILNWFHECWNYCNFF